MILPVVGARDLNFSLGWSVDSSFPTFRTSDHPLPPVVCYLFDNLRYFSLQLLISSHLKALLVRGAELSICSTSHLREVVLVCRRLKSSAFSPLLTELAAQLNETKIAKILAPSKTSQGCGILEDSSLPDSKHGPSGAIGEGLFSLQDTMSYRGSCHTLRTFDKGSKQNKRGARFIFQPFTQSTIEV